MTAEEQRLKESRERTTHWKRWGPYLAERAWGTVREDYSESGDVWGYLAHDHARSRTYRWNEDGLAGICDRHQRICFALAFWNRRDPILKERLFGLSGPEGNHGEDVKECYFYLDSTPTHSYMKYLYKYPQAEFPYDLLVAESSRRTRLEPEFEILDTGVFNEERYFDVTVEYAKGTADDIFIRITVTNRGPETAPLDILPTVWFRNRWAWKTGVEIPRLRAGDANTIEIDEPYYGRRWLTFDGSAGMLFTENETNRERLFGAPNPSPFVKDSINDYVVNKASHRINPQQIGTKASVHYAVTLAAGESKTFHLRFSDSREPADASAVFDLRIREADEFYATIVPESLSPDAKTVMRQALGGMLWSKQYYHYVVRDWLKGDPTQPAPAREREHGRNSQWVHLFNADVLSMPDKWEYPWYAAWDLAFHCVPLALVDSDFAKEQLLLMVREWYMHPNGQLPAYEWKFSDVNPPVHAWAALRVYKMEEKRRGKGDREFLERIFHKLLLNFTWWVNRKDADGRNVFQGGFLGLDNIGVFDRSSELPTGGHMEQADSTGWMAMYSLNLLAIALELANTDPAYEDVASKFWEHFLYIADAINHLGQDGESDLAMWDEKDGFFYDILNLPDGEKVPLKIRSIVGLIPLFAVETLEAEVLGKLSGFRRRLEWFIENRPDLTANVACMRTQGTGQRRLLSIVTREQLRRVLKIMLDENEFLSGFGIRALSRTHLEHPYTVHVDEVEFRVRYEPGESSSAFFGGNSNWRGPIWFPLNFLLIESLQKLHHYYGDDFWIEFPTGSGHRMTLDKIAAELSRRLSRIFLRGAEGVRPLYGASEPFHSHPNWKDLLWFFEYFHGDSGLGLGASHQTGWTGLVAKLLQQSGERELPS